MDEPLLPLMASRFTWWKWTCILLVIAGLFQVPLTGTPEISLGGGEASIVAADTEIADLPLACTSDGVRLVRSHKPVERQVQPVTDAVGGGLWTASRDSRGQHQRYPRGFARNTWQASLVRVVELRL